MNLSKVSRLIERLDKESANFFEACLPIEEIARRGVDTMRFDLSNHPGLWNPKWGDLSDKENRIKKRLMQLFNWLEDREGKLGLTW